MPHPSKAADLRVVDEQMDEPADYWMEFLGAHARRKEPELAKLAVITASSVLEERGIADSDIAEAIGASLDEAISSGKEEKPKQFVKRVAKKTKVPEGELWEQMSKQEPKLAEPDARVSPPAAELLKTTITLEHGVKVMGPSQHLDTRFKIEPAEEGEQGWIVRVKSAVKPIVKRTIVSGRR